MITDSVIPEHIFREFFLWLIFMSETHEGSFECQGEYIIFRVEDQLKLEGEGDVRQTDLKKGVPSISVEAKTSFQNGKLPTRMKAKIISGEDEYVFTIDVSNMEIHSVKIPVIPMKEAELKMEQRMFHLSQVYRMMEVLFSQFVEERVSEESWNKKVEDIAEWIKRD